ncbi:helix-turn-helix domain-containing protein [Chitinophaga barathri]|uniref:AraC family transcriptional regulator n=1 Tax=Chitinophaga barathri TaxID=1647451 RepID=A0A3N4M8N2_9BACT|nr:AraC family transcriptional regulator [Chitinophaga barathri]RPD39758.1 AraC family transcriptional regulator [Chitinophaga barathri]
MHPVYPNDVVELNITCRIDNAWLSEFGENLRDAFGTHVNIQDNTMELPPEAGQGIIKHFHIQEGITLIYLAFTPALNLLLKKVPTEAPDYYTIGYDVSPAGHQFVVGGELSRLDYLRKYSAYFRTSDAPIEVLLPASEPVQIVTLMISGQRVGTLFPQELRHVLKPRNKSTHGFFQVNEEIHESILDIGENLHNNSADYFFVRGSVNKLLALSLPIIAGQQQSRQKPEVEKLVALVEKLTADYSLTAPMLRDAARMTGVSPSKFKTIFRKIYKTSYYQYLLQHKMEKAKELLRDEQQTITSVAYMLGYSSCSHFTRLFRKSFSLSPQEYKNQLRSMA